MTTPLAIVMAAGKGTRMKSDQPKVLISMLGRPMIHYVIDALERAGIPRIIVVVGYKADEVKASLANREGVEFVMQENPLGTGHAVKSCIPTLAGHEGPVVVVTGDAPLMQESSLRLLLQEFERFDSSLMLGSGHAENPFGMGRIVRSEHRHFECIVEEKDATADEKRITEVNLSMYVFDCAALIEFLNQMGPSPVTNEYYITDAPKYLMDNGRDVHAISVMQSFERLQPNTPEELERAEEEMRRRLKEG